jgi:hypothetical protein
MQTWAGVQTENLLNRNDSVDCWSTPLIFLVMTKVEKDSDFVPKLVRNVTASELIGSDIDMQS